MQMGARWRADDPPHRSVPQVLHEAISEQTRLHPSAHSWTLTWLEGRPRCQLDDLVIVTIDQNSVVRTHDPSAAIVDEEADDGWLDEED